MVRSMAKFSWQLVHHVLSLAGQHLHFVNQKKAYFFRPDLIELVDGAHDFPRFFRHTVHTVESVQDFAVVHMDFKPLNSESSECIINDCRDFRLVHNNTFCRIKSAFSTSAQNIRSNSTATVTLNNDNVTALFTNGGSV